MTSISYTNDKLTIQMLAAITLVHNVHPVPRELADLDFVSRVWKIYEERGGIRSILAREDLRHASGLCVQVPRRKDDHDNRIELVQDAADGGSVRSGWS